MALLGLTKCMLGNFACFFVVCCFFSKSTFSKNSFRNTIRVSNRVDPDQARFHVGPGLGPNCLQKLSAEDTQRDYSLLASGDFCRLLINFANSLDPEIIVWTSPTAPLDPPTDDGSGNTGSQSTPSI